MIRRMSTVRSGSNRSHAMQGKRFTAQNRDQNDVRLNPWALDSVQLSLLAAPASSPPFSVLGFAFLSLITPAMKRPRHLLRPGATLPRLLLLVCHALLCSAAPGVLSPRAVTLSSIQIYRTHEWLGKPTVYFQCRGENITVLPDVKKAYFLYTFKGEESWQPLTELPEKKCKRCGIYEKDTLKPHDIFDEWELCPDDFLDGKVFHFKEKEFNATFICQQCAGSAASERNTESKSDDVNKKVNVGVLIIICVLASILVVLGTVTIYRYWQKKKRDQDQARFLKLFEEGDDIEDELGLGHVI